jgi:RNA polymerase sigma-70 factor (sigma-E family)
MKRVRKDMQTMRVSAAFSLTQDRSETFARDVQATKAELGRFAYLMVGSSTGADDLLAEAYARAWPHYKRGEIDNFPAYLRRSIANLSNGRLRRIRLERREVATRRIDWRAPRIESPDGGYEERIDTQDQLWRAIWSLPTRQRVVVVLRHAEDRSEEETAEMLGLSLGTVKSRLARGLATLREKLEHEQTINTRQKGSRS